MEGAGCGNQQGKGELMYGKALGMCSEETKWGPDPRTAAGDQLFPSPAVPDLTPEHSVSWAELCLRWWVPVPCASSMLSPTLSNLGHRVPGHGWWQLKSGLWSSSHRWEIWQGVRKGSAQPRGNSGCFLGALSNWGLFFLPPACGPGTFKSKQGEGPCSPCPPNSRTTSGAATVCTCRNGFFRADTDPADSACTSESCPGQGGVSGGSRGPCPMLCPRQR